MEKVAAIFGTSILSFKEALIFSLEYVKQQKVLSSLVAASPANSSSYLLTLLWCVIYSQGTFCQMLSHFELFFRPRTRHLTDAQPTPFVLYFFKASVRGRKGKKKEKKKTVEE